MYGKKYIDRYRAEITDMFEKGVLNSSGKNSAPTIWEQLIMKYPDRYDIPSEQEIRQEIGRLLSLQEKGGDFRNAKPGRRGRKGMDERYATILKEIVTKDPEVKPKKGYELFLQMLEGAEDGSHITEKQVRGEISSLKQAARKKKALVTSFS